VWTAWIKPDRNDDPQTKQCNRCKQSGSPPGLPSMTAALQHTSDAMIKLLHKTKIGNVVHSALHDSFSPSAHILSLTFPSDFDIFGTQDKILFNKYNWCMNNLLLLELFPRCQFYHSVFYYVNLFPLRFSCTDYGLYFMLYKN